MKSVVFLILLAVFGVFLGGCEAMDSILPSAGTYKINIKINNTALDELSFVVFNDDIRPFFEESISSDPDVTSLIVFIKNSAGDIVGERVHYSLGKYNSSASDADLSQDDEDDIVFTVASLDSNLPVFPIPQYLPVGVYTIVCQVMGGRNVLQRTERAFFYMDKMEFSFEGIDVYLPGAPESPQLIPRGTVVMLEARLDFDSWFNPYIMWYNGRRKISEGYFSDGAGQLFWTAPEQTGFFSLRAEVFPAASSERLTGFQKEVSLLVSSKAIDIHLVSSGSLREHLIPENSQQLQWYIFDGDIGDSQIITSTERAVPAAQAKWTGSNGTYGLAAGRDAGLRLPLILLPDDEVKTWQAVLRFLPIENGAVFSVLFGNSRSARMTLSAADRDITLTLSYASQTVSQTYSLTDKNPSVAADAAAPNTSIADEPSSDEAAPSQTVFQENSFITIGVGFTVMKDKLTAQINYIGSGFDGELEINPIAVETDIKNVFQVILGDAAGALSRTAVLWDEFALFYLPGAQSGAEENESSAGENQPESF